MLSYYDSKNKRHVKYISTGLPEKGNKRKAEAELVKIRSAFEPSAEIGELCSNMLFADYLLGWLEIVKVRVKPTAFGSYESMVKQIIEQESAKNQIQYAHSAAGGKIQGILCGGQGGTGDEQAGLRQLLQLRI